MLGVGPGGGCLALALLKLCPRLRFQQDPSRRRAGRAWGAILWYPQQPRHLPAPTGLCRTLTGGCMEGREGAQEGFGCRGGWAVTRGPGTPTVVILHTPHQDSQ